LFKNANIIPNYIVKISETTIKMRLLYIILAYFMIPIAVLRLFWRSRRAPGYRKRIQERFGIFNIPDNKRHGIWIHAVSVGEVLVAQPLVVAIQKRFPALPIVVTSTTPTGSERVKHNLPDSVFHVYAPYDVPSFVQRFIRRVSPKMLILIETELWPSILSVCYHRKIPTLLANARLSARSAKGYGRWVVRGVTRDMLHQLSMIAAQAKPDADRFIELGAKPDRVAVLGSVKFDLQLPQSVKESADLLHMQLGQKRQVWIAASTHEGEEEKILDVHERLREKYPNILLILVPRHPERFDKAFQLAKKKGFNVVRRTSQALPDEATAVYLGDTMGELRLLLGAADIAFIGGSFARIGGHNTLEAALFQRPVLTGPHIFNFAEITRLMLDAGGLSIVKTPDDLFDQLVRLFEDPILREQMGEKAFKVIEENCGALDKHLDLVEQLLCSPARIAKRRRVD